MCFVKECHTRRDYHLDTTSGSRAVSSNRCDWRDSQNVQIVIFCPLCRMSGSPLVLHPIPPMYNGN